MDETPQAVWYGNLYWSDVSQSFHVSGLWRTPEEAVKASGPECRATAVPVPVPGRPQ